MESSELLDKLEKAWKIVKWLDDARWAPEASTGPIPGDHF